MTEKQKKIFEFIKGFYKRNQRMPTTKEIAKKFNFSSTATVHDYLKRLTEMGYLKKNRHGVYEIAEEYQKGFIPFYGEVAAGSPISIYTEPLDYIEVPLSFEEEGLFSLKIKGNSMIEEGIFDGDIIIVKEMPDITYNGQTAVVVIDEDTSTVKRVFKRGDIIELRPANSNLRPMFYEAYRVRIVGIVKYLIRSF